MNTTDAFFTTTIVCLLLALVAQHVTIWSLENDLAFERTHNELLLRDDSGVVCPAPLIGGVVSR